MRRQKNLVAVETPWHYLRKRSPQVEHQETLDQRNYYRLHHDRQL